MLSQEISGRCLTLYGWRREKCICIGFLQRNDQSEGIGKYAITRVNIGDRPAGCIAQLAIQETAKFSHLHEERKVIEADSYVGFILTSHNDQKELDNIFGLVTPVKQKVAILVRKEFQEAGCGNLTKDTWDKPLSESLREEAIKLFEEYVQLVKIKFLRGLTPAGWKGKPLAITFSDGSEKTYGAATYFR